MAKWMIRWTARLAAGGVLFLLVIVLGMFLSPHIDGRMSHALGVRGFRGAHVVTTPEAEAKDQPRADRELKKDSQTFLPGGVLYVPPSFESADGGFDLLIHFHGNVNLVQESVHETKLNALVYVINLGAVFTRRYTDAYSAEDVLDELLENAAKTATQQGLSNAHAKRVALSAWSAGCAAIGQILRHRADRIDAVLLLDGMHAPYINIYKREADLEPIRPFLTYSERAVAGERLMVITHSNVETFTYASAAHTADLLLKERGIERKAVNNKKALRVTFASALRATPANHVEGLVPASEAHEKGLTVLGFRGDKQEHHAAHLVQMSLTVLPPLVERWRKSE
jgi:hypothetical protein